MVNKAIITDSSLLFAVIEALKLKGALPVGEVGKAMSIHCDATILSKYIKERYGGLKKYLERYPTMFVFGNDHEYNPHVFLTSKLSSEHLSMILRVEGCHILPMEVMIGYRTVSLFIIVCFCLFFLTTFLYFLDETIQKDIKAIS
jgi:hypothetical protein